MTIRIFSDANPQDEKAKVVSRRRAYSDLDLRLKTHPELGDVLPLKDIAAIKQSVKNLILTSKKERLFQPWLGSGVGDILFEPADKVTMSMLKTEIKRVLDDYEPRVKVTAIDIQDEADINSYKISIAFTIVNLLEDTTIEFYLERVR